MDSKPFATLFDIIFRELAFGSPDPDERTFVLNRGDRGLLASLDRISAAEASMAQAGDASIAAHVDHLRYGMSLLNLWGSGAAPPWPVMDWTASWKRNVVSEAEWRKLRDDLKREADAWAQTLRTPRNVNETEAGWMAGSVAHLAYHLGAIRQIHRATRGPTAEDEAKAEANLRREASEKGTA